MQLFKEEFARKRIHNGSSVQIENSITLVTVQHHLASLMMLNSYLREGIFNQHLTTTKDSYRSELQALVRGQSINTICTPDIAISEACVCLQESYPVSISRLFLSNFVSFQLKHISASLLIY